MLSDHAIIVIKYMTPSSWVGASFFFNVNLIAQVVLGTGDVVPADLRLFEAKDFKVSEMALTGPAARAPEGWT